MIYRYILIGVVFIMNWSTAIFAQKNDISEILGRPTDRSVTLSVMFEDSTKFFCEFLKEGDSKKMYSDTIYTQWNNVGEMVMDNLVANSKYEYRTARLDNSSGNFIFGDYHRFYTQRSKESTFRFVIESDPHPYDKKCYHPLWEIALDNQLADKPDFMLDLGDTFGDDHYPFEISNEEVRQLHMDNREYFGRICHSAPLFLCLGNHEGESGYYLLQNPPENLGFWGTSWRKIYYPNPYPDDFYSGNTSEEDGIGLPGNYYTWEWGDALFVVLDAYRYYTASAKPRNWEWTIGKEQYDWFKKSLEQSDAGFKFVFLHQIMGESRGGVLLAKGYEWGGYEKDGTNWTFTENRPDWEMPIHQLMVQNKVNILFQGHSHLFAQEELDGIIYQTLPMPSDSSYELGVIANADAYTGNILPGSGHLRVEVSPQEVTVDFVNAVLPEDETSELKNGDVTFSYTINKSGTISSISEILEWESKPKVRMYPNPFRENVSISFTLKQTEDIHVEIFNTNGKRVALFEADSLMVGENTIVWDTQKTKGGYVKSGIYICKISSLNEVIIERMIKVE